MIKLIHTLLGELAVGCYHGKVKLCDWTSSPRHPRHVAALRAVCPEIDETTQEDACLLESVAGWIDGYLSGHRDEPMFETDPAGTAFQKEVWRGLSMIPYGATLSYSALARFLGRPDAVRAVASACASNPVSLLIPCHRVVASDGRLSGYAGGLETKSALLSLESGNGSGVTE